MVPLAVGTDSGGSIRQPAGFMGTVGLKPSIGRIPRAYGFPALVADFQVIGLMARTVRDVEMLISVTAGPDIRDRASLAFARHKIRKRFEAARMKIVVVTEFAGNSVAPEIGHSMERAAAVFAAMGHEVQRSGEIFELEPLREMWRILSDVGTARVLQSAAQPLPEVGTVVKAAAARGGEVPASAYVASY